MLSFPKGIIMPTHFITNVLFVTLLIRTTLSGSLVLQYIVYLFILVYKMC